MSRTARLELLIEPTCVSVFVWCSGPADDRDEPSSMFTQACQRLCSSEANGWFLLFQVEPQTVAEVRRRRRLHPPLLPVLCCPSGASNYQYIFTLILTSQCSPLLTFPLGVFLNRVYRILCHILRYIICWVYCI